MELTQIRPTMLKLDSTWMRKQSSPNFLKYQTILSTLPLNAYLGIRSLSLSSKSQLESTSDLNGLDPSQSPKSSPMPSFDTQIPIQCTSEQPSPSYTTPSSSRTIPSESMDTNATNSKTFVSQRQLEDELAHEHPEILALLYIKQHRPARALVILNDTYNTLVDVDRKSLNEEQLKRLHRIQGIRTFAFLEMNELMQAIECSKSQTDILPSHPAGFSNHGWVLSHANDFKGAKQMQLKAIELLASYAPAHYRLSLVLGQLREMDQALEAINMAIHYDPVMYDALIHKASLMIDMGNLEAAKQVFGEAMKLDPSRPESYSELGNLLYMLGSYQHATAFLKEALRRDPKCTNAMTYMGNILAITSHLHEALEAYDNALEINPKCIKALLSKASVLCKISRYDQAIQLADGVITTDSNNAQAYFIKGQSLLKKVYYPEALSALEKSIEIDPYLRSAYILLFKIFRKLGHNDKILALVEKATSKMPTFEEPYYHRGLSQLLSRDYQSSIQSFQQALQLNPKHQGAWIGQIASLSRSERYQEGFDLIETIPQVRQTYFYHFARASLFCSQDRYLESLEELDASIQLNKTHFSSYTLRANILMILQRYEEAVQAYHQLIELNPSLGSLYIPLGDAYLKTGSFEKAVEYYELATKKDSLLIARTLQKKIAAFESIGKVEEAQSMKDELEKLKTSEPIRSAGGQEVGQVNVAGFSEIF